MFKNRIHLILGHHRLTKPLINIGESLISSAYWPVLREYLSNKKDYKETLGSYASVTDVTYALTSYSIYTLVKTQESSPRHIIIPVVNYPSDDELIDYCSHRLRIDSYGIFMNFLIVLFTPFGEHGFYQET